MDVNFQLTEELLGVQFLKDTTTGKDLFHAVENCIAKTGLEWNKMASVATDGVPALTGKNVGLLKLMNDKIKAEHPGYAFTPLHCIIHQESLCKGALNIKHVTDSIANVCIKHVTDSIANVVNLTRARGLNHRQFKAFLEDLESELWDVLYHSRVCWLSLGKVLRRVWELREEIVMFLEMKSIQCDFCTNIVDEEWRLDFKFAIDIMEKLNEFNVKLQGNGRFAHEMYVHVKSFQMKLSLFSRQADNNKFCHFPLLKEAKNFWWTCSKV